MIFDEELEDFLGDEIELSFNELSVVDDGAREKLAELLRGDIVNLDESYFDGVTEIRDYAFADCDKLESIVIPNNVTAIYSMAFYSCNNLKSVKIGDSVDRISIRAFELCESLTNINLPDSLATLNVGAFRGCSSLESIIIPNSVTIIYQGTFANCSSLKNIVIGKLVNSIQTLAFQNCTAIETFELLCTTPPSLNANAFNGAKIGRIIVPKGTLEAYKVAQYWSIYADIMEERQ